MKIINIYTILFLLMIVFYTCNSCKEIQNDKTDALIDSLINVTRINDISILVSFGADAIAAINTVNGIVVIDAGISTGLTSKFRKRIENEFQSDNFAYIINTHAHSDHIGGNSVFYESEIIAHEYSIEEIYRQWKYPEKIIKSIGKIVDGYDSVLKTCEPYTKEWYDVFKQKIRYQFAHNDAMTLIPIKKPDIRFLDSMNISMGEVTFELIHFGKCHSNSDIYIYVPELKLLFSGDLMSKYGRPSIVNKTMEDKEKWLKAVKWTEHRMNNIELIIGGHGQLLTVEDLKFFNRKILN